MMQNWTQKPKVRQNHCYSMIRHTHQGKSSSAGQMNSYIPWPVSYVTFRMLCTFRGVLFGCQLRDLTDNQGILLIVCQAMSDFHWYVNNKNNNREHARRAKPPLKSGELWERTCTVEVLVNCVWMIVLYRIYCFKWLDMHSFPWLRFYSCIFSQVFVSRIRSVSYVRSPVNPLGCWQQLSFARIPIEIIATKSAVASQRVNCLWTDLMSRLFVQYCICRSEE